MELNDTSMQHIEKAMTALCMLKMLSEPKFKKLASEKRVKQYYESFMNAALAMQDALVEDEEYTHKLQRGIGIVSKGREYSLQLTSNNDGELHYSLDVMVPLKLMKKHVLFAGRRDYVVTVS